MGTSVVVVQHNDGFRNPSAIKNVALGFKCYFPAKMPGFCFG